MKLSKLAVFSSVLFATFTSFANEQVNHNCNNFEPETDYYISGLDLLKPDHTFNATIRFHSTGDGATIESGTIQFIPSASNQYYKLNTHSSLCRDNGSSNSSSLTLNWVYPTTEFQMNLFGYHHELLNNRCYVGKAQHGWSDNIQPISFCVSKKSQVDAQLQVAKFKLAQSRTNFNSIN